MGWLGASNASVPTPEYRGLDTFPARKFAMLENPCLDKPVSRSFVCRFVPFSKTVTFPLQWVCRIFCRMLHGSNILKPRVWWFRWYPLLKPEASLSFLRLQTPSDCFKTPVLCQAIVSNRGISTMHDVGLIGMTSRNWEPQLPTGGMFVRVCLL